MRRAFILTLSVVLACAAWSTAGGADQPGSHGIDQANEAMGNKPHPGQGNGQAVGFHHNPVFGEPAFVGTPGFIERTVVLQDGLDGYAGTQDTYLSWFHPTLKFGNSERILHDATKVEKIPRYAPLVRFAIFESEGGPVPDSAIVDGATLSMYKFSAYNYSYDAKRVLKDWQESEANWNQANASTSWDVAGAQGVGSDLAESADGQGSTGWESGWLDVDVTGGVADFADGADNYGWSLVGVEGNNNLKRFRSSEYIDDPSLRPKLTITFRIPVITVELQDGLYDYEGTQDTYLSWFHPTLKFGASQRMLHDATKVEKIPRYVPMMKFDVFLSEGGFVPDGAVIEAATLSVYKYRAYNYTYDATRVLKDWQESEANWEQANATTPWDVAGALGVGTDLAESADGQATTDWGWGWLDVDVTPGVSAFAEGAADNFGWALVGISGNNNFKAFRSSEYVDDPTLRPKLTVVYRAPATYNF